MAEEAGGGQEEEAPAALPDLGFIAVDLTQDRHDRGLIGVEVGQPMQRGSAVVIAAPAPDVPDDEEVLELMHQAVAGHHSAGKEVLRDPVGVVGDLEAIGRRPVCEDVHEQRAVRLEPAAGARQQGPPVGHVLEHLHRDDAIEGAVDGEVVHIGGDDSQVAQGQPRRLVLDIGALGGGVRDRDDARGGIALRHP